MASLKIVVDLFIALTRHSGRRAHGLRAAGKSESKPSSIRNSFRATQTQFCGSCHILIQTEPWPYLASSDGR
eukprot:6470752-Amphidinium_carterae.1